MTKWHHAPLHLTKANGAYMLTGATFQKKPFFSSTQALDMLQFALLELTARYALNLRAWALFPNHYHLILLTYPDSRPLESFINSFHSMSGRKLNVLTNAPGRKVWYQYWDSQITYRNSYYARLNYVMQNPVRHGLVTYAEDYEWCSARWFKDNVEPGHFRTVTAYKTDRVSVFDDF